MPPAIEHVAPDAVVEGGHVPDFTQAVHKRAQKALIDRGPLLEQRACELFEIHRPESVDEVTWVGRPSWRKCLAHGMVTPHRTVP